MAPGGGGGRPAPNLCGWCGSPYFRDIGSEAEAPSGGYAEADADDELPGRLRCGGIDAEEAEALAEDVDGGGAPDADDDDDVSYGWCADVGGLPCGSCCSGLYFMSVASVWYGAGLSDLLCMSRAYGLYSPPRSGACGPPPATDEDADEFGGYVADDFIGGPDSYFMSTGPPPPGGGGYFIDMSAGGSGEYFIRPGW